MDVSTNGDISTNESDVRPDVCSADSLTAMQSMLREAFGPAVASEIPPPSTVDPSSNYLALAACNPTETLIQYTLPVKYCKQQL